ncbi:sigma-54-dependent Fis family transcriptional regulator [candidate division WOR-3 bacterium]|nr:sigma-54-dependent Fis family transcriptional regulator [candidate division WOR-3 bacterium]
MDLEGLIQVSRIVNSILDFPLLLEKVMDLAIQTVEAERGAIVLLDKNGNLECKVARHITRQNLEKLSTLSSSAIWRVINDGKPLLLHDTGEDSELSKAKSIVTQNIQSVLCVPLMSKEKISGAIYVDSRSSKGVFTRKNLKFLEAFSDQAAIAIENARLHQRLTEENLHLKAELKQDYTFASIIGKSPRMQEVFKLMRKLMDTSVSVFIGGETGTGKELVARALHYNGARKDGRFVPINCGSLPETLLESELFGYKKGAFTGAVRDKMGLFEQAHLGTLFLDEVADISLTTQAKLLRVLQEQEFFRIGDTTPRKVDVRVISATNKNLTEEIAKKRFREDLYYRLNVVRIDLPVLRERQGDIPLLAEHFLKKYASQAKRDVTGFTPKALRALERCRWPGNVRELENVIARAVVMEEGNFITPEVLDMTDERSGQDGEKTLKDVLKESESNHIKMILEQCKGNKTLAAKRLGISLRCLQYKLKELSDEKEIQELPDP